MKLAPSVAVNALLAALAVGTSVIVLATDDQPTTAELEARARNLFPNFPSASFRSLEVESGAESFRLHAERAANGGETRYVFDGSSEPADPEAVESLLRALELAGFVRRLEPREGDRASLGLDAPRATLTLVFANARYELRFGKDALTPAGTSYVEVSAPEAQPVSYLVRREFREDVLVSKDALRPKGILPFAFSEVQELSWGEGLEAVVLRRRSAIEFVSPQGRRAQRDGLDRLGRELASAKIQRFLPRSAAEQALAGDPRALAVTVTAKDPNKKLAARLGGTCPGDPSLEVVLRTEKAQAAGCVAPELRRAFRRAGEALAESNPFALHADEVESLRIERKEGVLELERVEKGFRMLAPVRQDVELDTGNARLELLLRTSGASAVEPDLDALGLNPPEGTLRLRSSAIEGSPRFEEVVQIGRTQKDGRFAVRRPSDGATWTMPAEAVAAYAVDAAALKPRRLLDFGLSELANLTIVAGGERQKLRRAGDNFELVEPAGHQHDGELALDLVQSLATLTADRWVEDAPAPHHGLADPKARLELEIVGADRKPRNVTLAIGADTGGGAFAALSSTPGVFVLPRAVVTQATTSLLSRAVFQVEPSELASIVLEKPGSRLTLRRRGESFFADADALSAPAVERVVQALANLRPEAALHAGPPRPREGFDAPRVTVELKPTDTTRPSRRIRVGDVESRRSEKLFFARIDGADATYLLPPHAVNELLNAFAN
jgi:hypothetical protein